ncbi:MAG: PilC/PilY family type IV pilus protein [Gammaproteobacteria bacterium]|nr:PilC/PilY family type IV pilus protein [Gammaproteobacteria bacterium]
MKDKAFNTIKVFALSAVIFITGNSNVYAVDLGVAQTPLFLGSTVQPNVFIVSDDSGSMDWETMMPGYWRYDSYDPDPLRAGAFYDSSAAWEDDGTWRAAVFAGTDALDGSYGYIYDNSDNVYGNNCDGSYYLGRAEICGDATNSPLDVDWRVRSASLNRVFYNADIDYEPWAGPCGYGDCADASFTAARSDSHNAQTGYTLIRNLETNGDAQGGPFVYEVWIDDSGFTGTYPDDADDFNETGVAAGAAPAPNGIVDLWDTHIRFIVGADGGGNPQIEVLRVTYDPQTSVEASPGLNETVTSVQTLSGGACYDVLGTNAMVAAVHATSNWTAVGSDGCRTIAEVRQGAANWYQYYRRRAFPVKNAVAAVINAQPSFRYGMTLLNRDGATGNNIFTDIPPVSMTNVTAHNTAIKEDYFQFDQPAVGTPLRMALQKAGEYYSNNITGHADPIAYSCQKNFSILFTDGYWNGSSPGVGNPDGDGVSETVADVAYRYYVNDLSGLDDNVKLDAGEDDLKSLPTYDSDQNTTHQHMVTFTVAFGVTGAMVDADGNGDPDVDYAGANWSTPGIPDKNGNWGPASSGPDKIDDLWHAAYNSSGTFASASTPDEIAEKLIDAISNIASRISSAAAVALNSGTLNANSRVYQASFDSNDWSGTLRSVPIQDGPVDILPVGAPDGLDDSPPECSAHPALGELCDEEWDAAAKLAARSAASRNIFTYNTDTNTGVEFRTLADLGATQQTALRIHPDTLAVETAAIGQQRLDYIRGDDANEGSSASDFRVRKVIGTGNTKLGDIIHSAPAYVANPDFFIPNNLEGASYNAYKIAQKNRTPMVYVGANDGMLHAFNASNNNALKGEEMFAYVPGKLVEKLPLLTSQNYNTSHSYFVDGSPKIFDAYGAGWKTLLAGSVGAGGQLVYALDITSPDSFDANDILWEFTDVNDADLGYTIGDVTYGRMANGRWAVIFGNGFNNTQADGNISTTGNAAIYVVDAFTGVLIKKFDTEVGMAEDPTGQSRPNGIASVTPIDVNGDYKVDYLYAGDLFGNVWKMDVRASNTSSWESVWTQAGGDPKPFYIAKDSNGDVQPITTQVAVKRHPEKAKETLVLFGTGSYFQVNDATTVQTQTFYSIWDDGTAAQYDRGDLLEQEILGVSTVTGVDGIDREFRLTSSANIDPASYKIDWATHKGWYMDLTESGERVNVEPILRGKRIIFVTLTPDPDPCRAGGTSWIMEVNANDGSRMQQSPFDVNGDGIINDLDIVTFAGDSETIVSGVRSKEGIVAKPGILNTKDKKELKYFSGTTGNIDMVTESVNENNRGRQSWRQLR